MQLFIIHSGSNIHSYKHSFNLFITFIKGKHDCRSKIDKITYLMKNLFRNQLRRCNVPPNHTPTCSLISQQRCHPRAGHDSPRNKEQVGLHIAVDTQNTAKPQHSWVYQAINKIAKPTWSGLSGHQGFRKA